MIFFEFGKDPVLINPEDTSILIVRFLCTVLLHIQLEGEIRTALSMIKYFNNHPENFCKATYAPFYIALMQFLGCIIAELLNIWLVCS